jgi:hypothetical protein
LRVFQAGSVKLECNKATYETIQVERGEMGLVHFKGIYFQKIKNNIVFSLEYWRLLSFFEKQQS